MVEGMHNMLTWTFCRHAFGSMQASLLEKQEAASTSAMETFKNKPEYSAYDELGMPTHDAEGKELTKSAKKVCFSSCHG